MPHALMTPLRDPENFGMYTYNDAAAYGVVEIFENILLDFDEAKDNWQEQWVICQGMMLWCYRGFGDVATHSDDSDQIMALAALLRTMFLSMLATLERLGLMGPNTEVKNLDIVMGIYAELAEKALDSAAAPPSYDETDIGSVIAAYANKYNIAIRTPTDKSDLVEDLQSDAAEVTLPLSDAEHTDPWNWAGGFKTYKKNHSKQWVGIGGDHYDVTTWTPSQRKEAAFDGKDPLSRSLMNKLNQGQIMSLG